MNGGAQAPAAEARRRTLASAVYGQIVSTAVVVTASEYPDYGAGDIALTVLATMLVFWAAHAFAEVVTERLLRGSAMSWQEVLAVMGQELPLVQSAVPALLALGLGAVGILGYAASVDLAIALGVLALFGWGVVIGRHSRLPWWKTVGLAAINGLFGLLLVLLKILVH
jgi:hypothetical protein